LSREEGARIWGNFSRFAVYEDLKELHHRCVPPINEFEDKLTDFSVEQEKFRKMIRHFDETLSLKASKEKLVEI
jgi:hypothetical protein